MVTGNVLTSPASLPVLSLTFHASGPAAVDLPEEEQLLRRFDLQTKYGPCAGITRLERWALHSLRTHKVCLVVHGTITALKGKLEHRVTGCCREPGRTKGKALRHGFVLVFGVGYDIARPRNCPWQAVGMAVPPRLLPEGPSDVRCRALELQHLPRYLPVKHRHTPEPPWTQPPPQFNPLISHLVIPSPC